MADVLYNEEDKEAILELIQTIRTNIRAVEPLIEDLRTFLSYPYDFNILNIPHSKLLEAWYTLVTGYTDSILGCDLLNTLILFNRKEILGNKKETINLK